MPLAIFQTIDFLTTLSNFIVALAVLGVALLVLRYHRTGFWLCVTATLLLAVLGLTPVSSFALGMLEDQYAVPELSSPPAGIIMLGGATEIPVSSSRHVLAINGAGERLTMTAALAIRFPQARILLSGGPGHIAADGLVTESSIARDLLTELNIQAGRISMEEHSRTTYQNAVGTTALVKPKPGEVWLLVTSAYHMPRAIASFHAAGFPVTAYPVDFRTYGANFPYSIPTGLENADLVVHEWLGMLAYRFAGRATQPDDIRP